MCGRFYNHLRAMHDWADILNDWPGDEHLLSYNVSPTNIVPIVAQGGVKSAHWGMIPVWSKEFKMNYATFNARIETVAEKASFKNAWSKAKTCLVPVGGYYEWREENGVKQPYVITGKQRDLTQSDLMLAGLWEQWKDQHSFTLLTQPSDGKLADLHARMPIFLDKTAIPAWLKSGQLPKVITDTDHLRFYPVDRKVGNSRNEGVALITPLARRSEYD